MRDGRTVTPDPEAKAVYDAMIPVYMELYEETKDLMHRMWAFAA